MLDVRLNLQHFTAGKWNEYLPREGKLSKRSCLRCESGKRMRINNGWVDSIGMRASLLHSVGYLFREKGTKG